MSYFLSNPYFYNSNSETSKSARPRGSSSEITYANYKSNRISRKGQLIEEESMLRRLRVSSQVQVAHRKQEILGMRIKYQL